VNHDSSSGKSHPNIDLILKMMVWEITKEIIPDVGFLTIMKLELCSSCILHIVASLMTGLVCLVILLHCTVNLIANGI
jgi:hypothetical protein